MPSPGSVALKLYNSTQWLLSILQERKNKKAFLPCWYRKRELQSAEILWTLCTKVHDGQTCIHRFKMVENYSSHMSPESSRALVFPVLLWQGFSASALLTSWASLFSVVSCPGYCRGFTQQHHPWALSALGKQQPCSLNCTKYVSRHCHMSTGKAPWFRTIA